MNNLKLIVKESKINNFGAFASNDIPADVFVIEYIGEKIDSREAERRENINDKIGVTFIFCLSDCIFVDGAVGGNESRFINHSCDPNCKIIRNDGKILFYSQKCIKKGDELTIDYSYDKDSKKEECNCGSRICRGFINEL